MSTPTSHKQNNNQEENFLTLKDLSYLCLSHWQWFVLSLFVCIGIATAYLLTTPPSFQRSASILVKEDSKSKSVSSDVASMFSDMGLSAGQSNVYNELNAIQSPAVLLETGKRLNYDVEYKVPGAFHKEVLYDKDLPVKVIFHDLLPEQSAGLILHLKDDNTFEISDFELSGKADLSDVPLTGKYNKKIETPVGAITVVPAANFTPFLQDPEPISVTRTNLNNMTEHIKTNLAASIVDEKATLIELTYTDVIPKRAEDVINMIITVYKESWMKDKNLMTVATSNFITERLGVIERELGDVDQNISSYKSSHLLPDVDAVSSLYMEQSKENASQILQLSTQRSICQYVKGYLTEGSKKNQVLPVNSGVESAAIETQIAEYNSTLLQRNSLVANSSETNPLVQDLDQKLVSQRSAILSSINNLLVSLDTQIAHLQQSEGATRSQIASSPNQAKYLQSVGRQQKVKETLYLFLLQKREENELSQAFTAYNTRIISPPSGSNLPVAPVRRNILLVAFLIGMLIPLVIIFIRETTNTKVRGRKDIENLTIPFLGEIPYYIGRNKRRWWQAKKPVEQRVVVVKSGKRDIINEAFRVLRTNIEFVSKNESGNANVILLTSFNAGSGKSFLSVNIAKSFAIRSKKVLVFDCDLRRGTSSEYVGSPEKGLTDYLSGKVDDVQQLIVTDENVEGMNVLPMGTIPPNPTELLYSERLAPLFEMLRQQYDYIFVDCPPVEIVADTQILEQYADRVVFVVRSGLLERSMVKDLQKLYDEKKHRNMSIILNGTESSSGRYGKYGYYRYGYGYGYGYGYHYGSKSSKKMGGVNGWMSTK